MLFFHEVKFQKKSVGSKLQSLAMRCIIQPELPATEQMISPLVGYRHSC